MKANSLKSPEAIILELGVVDRRVVVKFYFIILVLTGCQMGYGGGAYGDYPGLLGSLLSTPVYRRSGVAFEG